MIGKAGKLAVIVIVLVSLDCVSSIQDGKIENTTLVLVL